MAGTHLTLAPAPAMHQSFDVALHGMRLNTKGGVAPHDKMTDEKPKPAAPSVGLRIQEYFQRHEGAVGTACLALPLLVCLAYSGLHPALCMHERAWCGVVLVVLPVCAYPLAPPPTHAGLLTGVGLLTLVSTASTMAKDFLCMLVLVACSVHAYLVYSAHTAQRRTHRAVAAFVSLMLVLACVLTAELWHALSSQVLSAVLIFFVALYVVCLMLLKAT